MCVVSSTLIVIWFWAAEFPLSHASLHAHDFLVHGVNAIIAWTDLWLVGLPVYTSQAWAPMAFALTYIIFSAVYVLSGNSPNYAALNWSDKPELATASSLGVVLVPLPLTWLFACLKRSAWCRAQFGVHASYVAE